MRAPTEATCLIRSILQKPTSGKSARASRGFTLTEVLIVIVIIVILAAMLFPLTRSMRDKSSAVGCAFNMRQIVALSRLFAGDHNGQLLHLNLANKAATWGGLGLESISKDEKFVNKPAVYFWPDLLHSYNQSPDVFSCPKLKSPAVAGPGGGPSNRYPLGIGINDSPMARNNANDTDQDISCIRVTNVPTSPGSYGSPIPRANTPVLGRIVLKNPVTVPVSSKAQTNQPKVSCRATAAR